MAKKDEERRRRHDAAKQRRAAKKRAKPPIPRRSSEPKRAVSPLEEAANPLSFHSLYLTGKLVFGVSMTAAVLIERIKGYSWRESLIRLARLAAIVANDEAGPMSVNALRLTTNAFARLSSSDPATAAMLERGRRYVANAKHPLVLAHEEALTFLEHVVILYGADEGESPGDEELALWLLGAGDHLAPWLEEDQRQLDDTEALAAELAKSLRFNRSSVDEVRLLLRARRLFDIAPLNGQFATPSKWTELQYRAFGDHFVRYFNAFVLPLMILSHAWGVHSDFKTSLPMVVAAQLSSSFGANGPYFVEQLAKLTATREYLKAQIRERMRPDGLLPHAPTALLKTPFVDLENGGELVAATPWYVRAIARTGIWARYFVAAKEILGEQLGGKEWPAAFGQMLEEWCRRYALNAAAAAIVPFQVDLPTHPGATDEIEDVVTIENDGVAMFSVKARLVREDIARHALSRSKLLDWYEQFFFKEKTDKYRVGVIGQLSARIDRIRNGEFEPRVARNARVYPVLVTFDNLCDNIMLSGWLNERCKAHGLLQQEGIAPLTLAFIDDYERLLAAPAESKSPVEILSARSSAKMLNERLEVVLYSHEVGPRLPGADAEYHAMIDHLVGRLKGEPPS